MKPEKITKKKIESILVPLDGSRNSVRALKESINISKYTNSKIIGIYVIPDEISSLPLVELLQPLSTLKPAGIKQRLEKYSKKVISEAENYCKKNNIRFSGYVVHGNPEFEIVKLSKKKSNNISLIVIGSRGKGPTTEIFLGSVSNYVVHKSKIPVIIVK